MGQIFDAETPRAQQDNSFFQSLGVGFITAVCPKTPEPEDSHTVYLDPSVTAAISDGALLERAVKRFGTGLTLIPINNLTLSALNRYANLFSDCENMRLVDLLKMPVSSQQNPSKSTRNI